MEALRLHAFRPRKNHSKHQQCPSSHRGSSEPHNDPGGAVKKQQFRERKRRTHVCPAGESQGQASLSTDSRLTWCPGSRWGAEEAGQLQAPSETAETAPPSWFQLAIFHLLFGTLPPGEL